MASQQSSKRRQERSSVGHEVSLYMYDLSKGDFLQNFVPLFLNAESNGVWHTGIVVHGIEWFWSKTLKSGKAGATKFGKPDQVISLGYCDVSVEDIDDYVYRAMQTYNENTYNVYELNCNNFTNDVCNWLLGKSIPQWILNIPNSSLSTPLGIVARPIMEAYAKNRIENMD